jgi:hypothetical protein
MYITPQGDVHWEMARWNLPLVGHLQSIINQNKGQMKKMIQQIVPKERVILIIK